MHRRVLVRTVRRRNEPEQGLAQGRTRLREGIFDGPNELHRWALGYDFKQIE